MFTFIRAHAEAACAMGVCLDVTLVLSLRICKSLRTFAATSIASLGRPVLPGVLAQSNVTGDKPKLTSDPRNLQSM